MKGLLALRHRISFRLYLAIMVAVSLTFAASLVGWFSFDRVGLAQSRVNEESIPEIAAAFAVAQYTGDLITGTDRLSAAATSEDLASIREYIGGISPALSERVAFLAELRGGERSEAERLMRIRSYSDALVAGVSEFERNILEYFELSRDGAELRRRVADAHSVLDDVATSAMRDEVSYMSESFPESGSRDLHRLVDLQEDINVVSQSLSGATIAVEASEIDGFQDSFRTASADAERQLAELAHLPSHGNLTRAFRGLASLGAGDTDSFEVWKRELLLSEQRRELLEDNYQTALLLIGDVEGLVIDAQARAQGTTDNSAQAIGLGRVLLLAVSISSLVGALLVAWLLVDSLLRRLGRISVRMRRMTSMGSGDLAERVEAMGKDEVGEMADALETFRQNALEVLRLNEVEKLARDLNERNAELAEALGNLQQTQDRLIAQEKLSAMGELVAGLAHEINNPLNFVNNFSESSADLLREIADTLAESEDGRLNAVQRRLLEGTVRDLSDNLERIMTNGNRASQVVSSMLAMGRDTDVREPIDINHLLDERVQVAYNNARAANENFRIDVHREYAEIADIEINPPEMGRVFANLVNNAFYATDEKRRLLGDATDGYSPALWLSTRRVEGGVEIRLRDNGNGIAPEVLGRIFNPFFTTKPTDSGAGLGLTICYDAIHEHGGSIEIASEPGEFTEVLVVLPVDPTSGLDVDDDAPGTMERGASAYPDDTRQAEL